MDKLINLFKEELKSLEDNYSSTLKTTPIWQIDAVLPSEYKTKSTEEKTKFLIQKFKATNPIYVLVNEDLMQILNSNAKNLKIFNIDPRYLESKGLQEDQIKNLNKFVDLVKKLI